MRAMTTWFCDAYASWQKGGVEHADRPAAVASVASAGCRLRRPGLFTGHAPFPPHWRRGRRGRSMRDAAAPGLTSRPAVIAGAAAIVALAGTVLLWAHYGATVFFEMIRAGLTACFG
jgi:hypothetical protein